MKKIIMILCALISMQFNSSAAKSGWGTALADASGVIGGGAAGLTYTGGVAATNPIGWVGVGLCGLVCGAAASINCSVGPVGGGVNPIWPPVSSATFPDIANELNNYDAIGGVHNQIVSDYMAQYSSFSIQTYLNFLSSHKTVYNLDPEFNLSNLTGLLTSQTNAMGRVRNIDDIIKIIVDQLPTTIDKNSFKQWLINTGNLETKLEILTECKRFENEIIYDGGAELSQNDKVLMEMFFSTLRNSTILWN